jgi:AraC-like DNA-binding protein
LRALRIKYAVSLFDRGLDAVKNVAVLSGFSDPLYFSNVFKRTVGMSPKEYLSTVKQRETVKE